MPYSQITEAGRLAESQYILEMEKLQDKLVQKVFELHPSLTMFAITAEYWYPNGDDEDEERDFNRGVQLHWSERGIPDDLESTTRAELVSKQEFKQWFDGDLLTVLNGFITMLNYKYTPDVFLLFTRAGQQYSLYAPEDLP